MTSRSCSDAGERSTGRECQTPPPLGLRGDQRRECSAGEDNDEPAEKRDGERGDVETNVLHSGSARGAVREQQADQPVGQQHAGDAGHGPQADAFGQQLADQPGPPGAESRSHRELAAPPGGSCRQQAADVGASDDEQAQHGGKAEPHAAARPAADDVIEQWDDPDIDVPVDSMRLAQACGDHRHLRRRLVEADPRLQAAEHLD